MGYTFKNPDPLYRGTDFWMLNGKLTDDELMRQIDSMHEQGVNSFIARTYIGLRSDYPGPDFHRKTGLILERAKKYGMRVFLQAGYMPEAVLELPESCALYYISAKSTATAENETLVKDAGDFRVYFRNSVTFLNMFNEEAVDFYISQSYEKMWHEFREEYGKTVLSIWVDEPSYDKAYLPWSMDMKDIFQKRYGYDLTEKIDLLFRDDEEGECRKVRYDYWTMAEERLGECYFRRLRRWCNKNGLWFSGHLMMEDTLKTTISRACANMPYYKYFDIPGIDKLCGFFDFQYDPHYKNGGRTVREFMELNTPLQCTSAARQNGQEHVLCEMYGVTSQGMNFRDMKQMFDHYAAFGINHRSVHGMFYSLHGRGKRAYPPHVNYYQPYFKKYRDVTDYVARTSSFISMGEPVRNVLVLHPLESAYSLYKGNTDGKVPPMPELDRLDNAFHDTLVKFAYSQIPFDLGDEMSIRDSARVEGSRFILGKMSYDTVVLPCLSSLRASTLPLLEDFAEGGGKLVLLGNIPECIDGKKDEKLKERLLALPGCTFTEDADKALGMVVSTDVDGIFPAFDSDASSVLMNHRRDGSSGSDYYFLVNDDCKRRIAGRFVSEKPFTAKIYDAKNGEIAEKAPAFDGEKYAVPFLLYEGGSVAFELCRKEKVVPAKESEPRAYSVLPLTDKWDITPEDDNVLLMEFCRFKKGGGEYSPVYPMLAIHEMLVKEDYRGEVTFRFTFRSEEAFTGLRLAIEDASQHRITLNGVEASSEPTGYFRSRDFETVALPDVCRIGENELVVTRYFEPLQKFRSAITSLFENLSGCELENMYLLGDFAVRSRTEFTRTSSERFAGDFVLTRAPKTVGRDLPLAGYPFFAGTVKLSKKVKLTKEQAGSPATFYIGEFHGCVAEVTVNGERCEDLCWYPYECGVTGKLREGENEIVLRITNTLRPMLGPYHRVYGEAGELWGTYNTPNKPWLGVRGENDLHWQDERTPDTAVWTDSYMVIRFGAGDAGIRFE